MSGLNVVAPAVDHLFQEFRTDLFKAIDEAPEEWRDYAMEVPSSSRSSLHAWLANQAVVEEAIGPMKFKGMSSRSWEVLNRKWRLGFEFDRDQIDDDLSGLTSSALMQARAMGGKFVRHQNLLLAATREAGTSALCHDGQFFYDTDHPIDVDGVTSGTFDNDLALALTHANANTALTGMMNYKNVDGSPMVPMQGIVCRVPTALAMTAKQIFEIDTLTPAAAYGLFGTSGASKNPLVGRARVVVDQYLTVTNAWYLDAIDGPIKPFMLQSRRPLEMEEQGPGSPIYFEEEKIRFKGSARYAASYTLPQLSLRSIG
jgi:phage major head subunit gpT-like protein